MALAVDLVHRAGRKDSEVSGIHPGRGVEDRTQAGAQGNPSYFILHYSLSGMVYSLNHGLLHGQKDGTR